MSDSRIDPVLLTPSTNGLSLPQKGSASKRKPQKTANGTPKAAKPLVTHSRVTIAVASCAAASTVVTSICLNVWAFTNEMGSTLGTAVGVMVPLWVLALTYVAERRYAKDDIFLTIACAALAGFLLAVSLSHLAHGYATVVPVWEGWSLAVVTDLLQVAMKLAIIRTIRGR